MCLRCNLDNYVPHFSPKKILPPLKQRPSYGLGMIIEIKRMTKEGALGQLSAGPRLLIYERTAVPSITNNVECC